MSTYKVSTRTTIEHEFDVEAHDEEEAQLLAEGEMETCMYDIPFQYDLSTVFVKATVLGVVD